MTAVLDAGPISRQEVFNYFAGAGNGEIKTQVGVEFTISSSDTQTAIEVAKSVNARQAVSGGDGNWQVAPRLVRDYCERSLGPIAGIVEGSRETGWHGVSGREQQYLALAGVAGKWSLRRPDLSVQYVLGNSRSPSGKRAPVTRLHIFSMVKAAEETKKPLSIIDIADALNETSNGSVHNNVDTLADMGYLQVTSNRRNFNPDIRINSTEVRPGYERRTEIELLYKAIGKVGAGQVISMNELVDRAVQLDRKADPAKLRVLLHHRLFNGHNFPGLSFVEEQRRSLKKQSVVTFHDDMRKPISELLEGIAAVRDTSGVEFYAREALAIADDPVRYRRLIAKGRFFSATANGNSSETNLRFLLSLVENHGTITINDAAKALKRKNGVVYTAHHVGGLLQYLVGQGSVKLGQTFVEKKSKIPSNQYSKLALPAA